MSAEEAKEKMDNDENIVILDVRTLEEYDEKHIPGAVVIPNETIKKETLKELPDLEQEILVYCRSGNRSRQAAEKLIEAGYTNVYDFGGINEWTYETE
ncbi:rhodanese-like domain-containing protein [Bariatricus massiliensis]|uniref:rhodanese-like domain-containing protein n=1 Tax=Bariatricus massiliensis TaxID=1745713 RepID=UPI0027DF92E5|nr:rhodanese-like domain-containing protein [Bariatricus massiliensis]MDY2663094.1 rhodanese-like domain-containing protein [Bariatricus massiliensis]